jgi:hypothetical protein
VALCAALVRTQKSLSQSDTLIFLAGMVLVLIATLKSSLTIYRIQPFIAPALT